MTGLCGFVGGALARETAREAIVAMANGLNAGAPPVGPVTCEATDGAALALTGGAESGTFSTEGGVLAAVVGTPDWLDPADAGRARQVGAARALAEAYARLGPDVPKALDGCAFAVVDPAQRRAVAAIDRIGVHPMCFAALPGGGIGFATTTISLGAYPGLSRDIDYQALYDMIVFSRVPAPLTIFRGRSKLLPAQRLHWQDGRVDCARYWEMPYDSPKERDVDALGEELVRLTEEAVARARGETPGDDVGAFLSGGLDSSTVVGMLARRTGSGARAFTIGFAVEGYDEMDYARKAAAHFGAKLHERYLTPAEVTDLVPKIAAAYDEPFANSSAVPALVCAQTAREAGVTVMLAGDGGDEIFAGNSRYAFQKMLGLYGAIPGWLREGVLEPVVKGFPGGDRIMPVRRARGFIRHASMPMPDRTESFNPVLWRPSGELFAGDIAATIDTRHPLNVLREVYERTRSPSLIYRMLHLDQQVTLADDDLRKVTRTCEMAGVRVRFPLLDRRVVELSARVPPDTLLKGYKLRHFYRHAFRRFLPPSTLAKKKHGFGNPFGHWLREWQPLQDLVAEALADLRRRGIFRPEFLDETVRGHRETHAGYYGELIWELVVVALWLRARGY